MGKLKPVSELRDNSIDLGTLICLLIEDSKGKETERIFGCVAQKHYEDDYSGRYPQNHKDETRSDYPDTDKVLTRIGLSSRYPNGSRIGSLQIMPDGSGLYVDHSRKSGADKVMFYEILKRYKNVRG
jgi:hypothetical protein